MPGGVAEDPHDLVVVLVPADLLRAGLLGERAGCVEVVDEEIEVLLHLLGARLGWPDRRDVVALKLEGQLKDPSAPRASQAQRRALQRGRPSSRW